jgi:hypothetical protein
MIHNRAHNFRRRLEIAERVGVRHSGRLHAGCADLKDRLVFLKGLLECTPELWEALEKEEYYQASEVDESFDFNAVRRVISGNDISGLPAPLFIADAHPTYLPGTVLLQEIVEQGYNGGTTILREFPERGDEHMGPGDCCCMKINTTQDLFVRYSLS